MNLFSKMAGALIVIAALLFIPALASAADEDVIDKAPRQINSEYIRVLRMQLKDAKRKCDRDTKYCDLYLLRLGQVESVPSRGERTSEATEKCPETPTN